jgi:hypothetical protein
MPEQALTLISAFLEDVHHGHSLHNTKNPSDKTICGYMTSATEAWKALTGMTIPLFKDPKDSEQAKLKPIVADILSQHWNWKPTKQKREPYTFEMFKALNDVLSEAVLTDCNVFLQEQWGVFDWTHLGVFTGSHLAEYGQSKPRSGELGIPHTVWLITFTYAFVLIRVQRIF